MIFRVVVLGSGTIIPSQGRRATAILVEADGELLLFDCGPGALEALEENGVSFRSIRTIFLTHFHPDHSLGLAHLLAARNVDPVAPSAETLYVRGPSGLRELAANLQACYGSMIPRRDFLDLVEIGEGDVPCDCAPRVSAARASHGDCSALAYRVDHRGASVVFTGDTSFSPSLARFAEGADCLVAECSFPDERPVEGHLTPSAVGRLAAEAGVARVILVHMYPLFEGGDPVAAVKRHFAGSVEIGYDSMAFDVASGTPR